MPSMNDQAGSPFQSSLTVSPLAFCRKCGGCKTLSWIQLGKKRRNTRQCLKTTFSHGWYRFATFFQTRMLYVLYTVVKILDSLGIYGDLQKWHLSLFYLGSLVCCGWRWCWHSWCAKAIKVTKIPKNTRPLLYTNDLQCQRVKTHLESSKSSSK